jgi:hypothetical protein
MYIEETTKFKSEAFWDFNALVEVRHDAIPMKWVTEEELDLNASRIEFLSFELKGHSIPAIFKDPVTKATCPVTRDVYVCIVAGVKTQALGKTSRIHLAYACRSRATSACSCSLCICMSHICISHVTCVYIGLCMFIFS